MKRWKRAKRISFVRDGDLRMRDIGGAGEGRVGDQA